ncbi:MAG: TrmB family transcriptional regulator [Candidatus Bathyarchaeia archaeon]
MSRDETLERGSHELSRFGLTPLQSKIYITLLMLGASPARKVAKASAIHRVEVYRVIKTLKNVGLVEEILGSPNNYRAVEPGRALKMLVSQEMSRVESLAEKAREVGRWLSSVQGRGMTVEPEERVSFIIVEGRRRVYDKVFDMIERAGDEVLAMMTVNGLRRAVAMGMLDLIEGCVKRGVKVRILSKIEDANLKEAVRLKKVCGLRHDNQLTSHIQIMDDREVMIGALDADDVHLSREEHVELWTNNKVYVCLMREFFEGRWRESTSAYQRVRFLRTGTPIEETYFIKDNREAQEKLKEKIATAEREVFVLTPSARLSSLLSNLVAKRVVGGD